MKGQELRLTVTDKETGRTVFSIPLIDYALLVKGFYNRDMDDQEYLDRQDVYDMVFLPRRKRPLLDAYIYVNSWKVVLHNECIGNRRNANEESWYDILGHGNYDAPCVVVYLVQP